MSISLKKGGVAAALFLLAALGCQKSASGAKASAEAAPDFTLTDISGKQVSLKDYRGKVVLVDFWATWCPPCRVSIPAMEELHKEYGPKGLQVLSISMDEETGLVAPFAREHGMTYPILLGAASDVSERYRVRGIPALYLVDQDGKLVRQWLGFDDSVPKQWRESLDKLLS